MGTDMYPGKEADIREEARRIEILFLLLGFAAVLAILGIYGDAMGIYDKIFNFYGDIWEILFLR